MAIHVSNRYYDLTPALGSAGARLGVTVLSKSYAPTPAESAAGASLSGWVLMLRDVASVEPFRLEGWTAGGGEGGSPLTDDHPDVLRFLRIGG